MSWRIRIVKDPRTDNWELFAFLRDERGRFVFTADGSGYKLTRTDEAAEMSPLLVLTADNAVEFFEEMRREIGHALGEPDKQRELQELLRTTEGARDASQAVNERLMDMIERRLLKD